jgi:hypothetical protein
VLLSASAAACLVLARILVSRGILYMPGTVTLELPKCTVPFGRVRFPQRCVILGRLSGYTFGLDKHCASLQLQCERFLAHAEGRKAVLFGLLTVAPRWLSAYTCSVYWHLHPETILWPLSDMQRQERFSRARSSQLGQRAHGSQSERHRVLREERCGHRALEA